MEVDETHGGVGHGHVPAVGFPPVQTPPPQQQQQQQQHQHVLPYGAHHLLLQQQQQQLQQQLQQQQHHQPDPHDLLRSPPASLPMALSLHQHHLNQPAPPLPPISDAPPPWNPAPVDQPSPPEEEEPAPLPAPAPAPPEAPPESPELKQEPTAGPDELVCGVSSCLFRTLQPLQMAQHREQAHDVYMDAREDEDYVASFHCSHCFHTAASVPLLQVHFRAEHAAKLAAKSAGKLQLSADTGQLEEKPEAAKAKKFTCNPCSFATSNPASLKIHVRVVHESNQEALKCAQCEFVAVQPAGLKRHIRTVHERKKGTFACVECDARFYHRRQLAKHTLIHEVQAAAEAEAAGLEWGAELDADAEAAADDDDAEEKKPREPSLEELMAMEDTFSPSAPAGPGSAHSGDDGDPDYVPGVKQELPDEEEEEEDDDDDQGDVDNGSDLTYARGMVEADYDDGDDGDDGDARLEQPPDDEETAAALAVMEAGGMKMKLRYKRVAVKRETHELRVNEDNETFSCPDCELKTSDRQLVTKHIYSHHNKKVYQICNRCDYKCDSVKRLEEHASAVHDKLKPYPCDQCDYKASLPSGLSTHKLLKHKKDVTMLYCSQCPVGFKQKSRLNYHIKARHSVKTIPCPQEGCDYMASVKGVLNSHMRNVHGKKPPIVKKNFCEHCGAAYEKRANLLHHIMSVHKKLKPYLCHLCGYETSYQRSLKNHVRRMHKEYSCGKCDFTTLVKTEHEKHERTAHGDKCPTCGFIAQPNENLSDHRCSDPNNASCHVCGFRPTKSSYLAIHIRMVHEKVKPFACDMCDYRSGTKQVLEDHVKSVHLKERNYECHLCGHKMYQRKHLLRHLRSHGDQEFKCKHADCDFKTTSRYHFRCHEREQHVMIAPPTS